MFDPKKRKEVKSATVGEMIELLGEYNPEAEFHCCGDEYLYIHAEKDGSTVSVDNASLDDEYPEDDSDEDDVSDVDRFIDRDGGGRKGTVVKLQHSGKE